MLTETTPKDLFSEKVQDLVERSQTLFANSNPFIPPTDLTSSRLKRSLKLKSTYPTLVEQSELHLPKGPTKPTLMLEDGKAPLLITDSSPSTALITVPTNSTASEKIKADKKSLALVASASTSQERMKKMESLDLVALTRNNKAAKVPTPQWHAPWELSAVISGHLGWVRCLSFDPTNEWFVTGSTDRTIKIWDLAKCCAGIGASGGDEEGGGGGGGGGLKLTLTGHISAVRAVQVSDRHPYLFSAGEDKMVKCWDLEYNKSIRHYHGHLSGVFSLALHPTLDVLITGGRDSVARVWDMRTKNQIQVLGGHTNTVGSILTNSVDPQVVTASYDSTIKLWDLAAGRSMSTLTHHKKAVRSIVSHPKEFSFLSASADNVKRWQTRDGKFLNNFSHGISTGGVGVLNCLAACEEGIVVGGGDNGSLSFWDYKTGYCFQKSQTVVQPGSLDAEAGIFAMGFDLSGSRLLTCEADKTIKIWKENPDASEETHPIDVDGWTKECLKLKRF